MALKVLDENNQSEASVAQSAINYTAAMRNAGVNIRVTNSSFIGSAPSPSLLEAIHRSDEADILFVAAAGNGNLFHEGINIDIEPRFPAGFNTPNTIGVTAASSNADGLAPFANFGDCDSLSGRRSVTCSVDIAAPGVGVISTKSTRAFDKDPSLVGSKNGTSMAAPHVTGVAALLFAREPQASAIEVREAILSSAQSIPGLHGLVESGGILDAEAAFQSLLETPTATLLSIPSVTSPSAEPLEFEVQYRSNTESGGIDFTSLDDNELVVRRAGYPQTLQAEFVSACWDIQHDCIPLPIPGFSAPTELVKATYQLTAPTDNTDLGFTAGWDAIHNGDYSITLPTGVVRNADGVGNREVRLVPEGQDFALQIAIQNQNVIFVESQLEADTQLGLDSLRSALRLANQATALASSSFRRASMNCRFPALMKTKD